MSGSWLKKWDIIVFDCDGVLLDSNLMKIDAFRRTLQNLDIDPAVIEIFSEHQRKSFGISRHRLFTELLDGEFGKISDQIKLSELLTNFGRESLEGYFSAMPTKGAIELLEHLCGSALYVASGSDEAELKQVFAKRNWDHHFREIYGSPTSKTELLMKIAKNLPIGGRALMIGDAIADFSAAKSANFDFLYVAAYSTVRDAMLALSQEEGFKVVETLAELLPPSYFDT